MDEKLLSAVPFTFDLDFKSIDPAKPVTAIELEDGQLLIEGWGANYDVDRENEAFEDGAFTKGLKKFLAGNAPLLYHHQYSNCIGKVVDAEVIPGKGVRVKAIVDRQPESSPLRHIYEGIKRGRINGLSCGGIFSRRMTKTGPKIHDVELLEWSATPVPVGRGTSFSVIAGKALQVEAEEESVPVDDGRIEGEVKPGEPESGCPECKARAEAEAKEAEEAAAKEAVVEGAEEGKEEAEKLAAELKEKEEAEQADELSALVFRLETILNSFGKKEKPKSDGEEEKKEE